MNLQNKIAIHQLLLQQIEAAIVEAKTTLQNTIEARNNESKSSAGDKYETGRAMMQIEQQHNEIQLNKLLTFKAKLQQISTQASNIKITHGSLVLTNHGLFYISIPYGKIRFQNEEVYFISLVSPIAKQLVNKKQGDTFNFLNKNYKILQVI